MHRNEQHLSDHAAETHDLIPLFAPKNLTQEQKIVSEIAARLLEWRDLSPAPTESKPFLWIQRIASLGLDNPDALWLYLSIQSGDPTHLTDTYAHQASQVGTSRQAIEQRHSAALHSMSIHYPELQSAIISLRTAFRPPRGINVKVKEE